MKMELTSDTRKTLVDIAGSIHVPSLLLVPHAKAHENFTRLVVTRTLLCTLRISKGRAERLAAMHKGCPRVRLAKIMELEGK